MGEKRKVKVKMKVKIKMKGEESKKVFSVFCLFFPHYSKPHGLVFQPTHTVAYLAHMHIKTSPNSASKPAFSRRPRNRSSIHHIQRKIHHIQKENPHKIPSQAPYLISTPLPSQRPTAQSHNSAPNDPDTAA